MAPLNGDEHGGRPTGRLERLVRRTQARARIPALSVAVHRHDRPLWTLQIGASGSGRALDRDTRFRIGSITKTFTAVLVMQCRDDGLLELDDPIGRHTDVPRHGGLTIRQLLAHTSGIQREPPGDVWDGHPMPDLESLIDGSAQAQMVLPAGRRYHYSNLGVALLGHMVAKLRGGPWAEVLTERVLAPIHLNDIGVDAGPRAAVGYLVDEYSDHAQPQPAADFAGLTPACQLWSTAADLARWAAFLADPGTVDPAGRVLAPATVAEMRWPVTPTDETTWAKAFGLGVMLMPQPHHSVHVGHVGSVPGFLAAAYGRVGGEDTPPAFGAAVLGSSATAAATLSLPHRLLSTALEDDPADIEPWRPGPMPPPGYRSALGSWWSEGLEYVFAWRGGLRARLRSGGGDRPWSLFEPTGEPDVLRTTTGREVGERLRLHRHPVTGEVAYLRWATYRFSRTPG